MSDFILLNLKQLALRWKKFQSTVVSIAIGTALVVVISAVNQIGTGALQQELDGFGLGSLTLSVNRGISGVALSEEKLQDIRTLESVEHAVPILLEYTQAYMKGLSSSVALWGIDSGSSQIISVEPLFGRLFTPQDIVEARYICLVDENMAKAYYGRSNIVGKILTVEVGVEKIECEIVGVVKSGGSLLQSMLGGYMPFFAYLPYSTLQQHSQKNGFDQIAIELSDQAETEAVGQHIINSLSASYHERSEAYHMDNMAVQKQRIDHIMQIVTQLLIAISAISLLVSGLGIMTVMSASVAERTHEIGIKKAVGAKNHLILLEFLVQGSALSVVGSVLGCIFGTALVWVGCVALHLPFELYWETWIQCVLAVTLIGAVCSARPAMTAAALDPVQALTHD